MAVGSVDEKKGRVCVVEKKGGDAVRAGAYTDWAPVWLSIRTLIITGADIVECRRHSGCPYCGEWKKKSPEDMHAAPCSFGDAFFPLLHPAWGVFWEATGPCGGLSCHERRRGGCDAASFPVLSRQRGRLELRGRRDSRSEAQQAWS